MFNRICELHKRIMKRDSKAIDEIATLEEAKEIIKMMANTIYLHGQSYQVKERCKDDCCLSCRNSMSGDAPDGIQMLVCFDCEGYEGKEMIVGEDGCCGNYKGE